MSRPHKISDAAFAVLVAIAIALGLIARIVYGPAPSTASDAAVSCLGQPSVTQPESPEYLPSFR